MGKIKGQKHNRIKVGDKFTLKCNNTVTVVEYVDCNNVTFVDENNKQYTRSAYALRQGQPLTYVPQQSNIKVGDVFDTKSFGQIEVLVYEGKGNCTVQFLNTGFIRENVPSKNITRGSVRDYSLRSRNIHIECNVGDRFLSDLWGWYTVLEYRGCYDILIQWDDTGETQKIWAKHIKTDTVKDGTRPVSKSGVVMPRRYYVYIATVGDVVCYVGYGKKWRFQHCTSGISSSFGLNKLFFEGSNITVTIHKDDMTKEDAVNLEKELIRTLKPTCNIVLNSA